jgi:membrane protein required for colicin V production
MNGIDIAVIVICFLSILVGFIRGFIASLFSTTGWILAIVGNHYLFNSIGPFLDARFQSKILTFLIGYIGGLVILLFGFSIFNFIVLSMINKFRTGLIDRFLGGIFGFVRGSLIVIILFVCFETVTISISGDKTKINLLPEILLDAKSLPLIKQGEIILLQNLPDTFKMKLQFNEIGDVSEMTLLNLVRKLSIGVPDSKLNKIDNDIEQNAQYISKRQLLIAKISELWKYSIKHHRKTTEKLSTDEMKIIQSIVDK